MRINRVTPITAASLVTTTLLALQDRAATLGEITAELGELVADVEQRSLPTAGSSGSGNRTKFARCSTCWRSTTW